MKCNQENSREIILEKAKNKDNSLPIVQNSDCRIR